MPSMTKVIQDEITRLAKKEAKVATADLRRSSVSYRTTIADFRRRIAKLEQDNKRLLRELGKVRKGTTEAPDDEVEKARITGKMIRSVRARLGLSQGEFAELVGVARISVGKWEGREGRLVFRDEGTKARIVAARGMTKAEAWEKLG